MRHPVRGETSRRWLAWRPASVLLAAVGSKNDCRIEGAPVTTPHRSTGLDNGKVTFLMGWRPPYELPEMIEAAWAYQRAAYGPRKVWYPG